MTRCDSDWSPGYDYAGRWLWRAIFFGLVVFLGHVVLRHVGFVSAWVDRLPATVDLPQFGGTLPLGNLLRFWQSPTIFTDWINAILAKVPQ